MTTGEEKRAGRGDAYRGAGVDYEVLDAAKRRSIEAVMSSLSNPAQSGARIYEETVGEPAQLFEVDGVVLATVIECLGTKSEIAREVQADLGSDHWAAIGVDAVAAVVNDLCCSGAVPLSFSAYLATGSARWYAGTRHASFVEGLQRACSDAGAAWVGGESPTLAGIVGKDAVDIAGSAVGRVPKGAQPYLGGRLEEGDEIVLVSSSGLHANGSSLARAVARELPARWATKLPSGASFGEAVLAESVVYARLVRELQSSPLHGAVHYASHITGHGLRKLMRAPVELTYRVGRLPLLPEVLEFLCSSAGLDAQVAYGTYNMGCGFALYVEKGTGDALVEAVGRAGYSGLVAGSVEAGPRQVVIEPVAVSYSSDDLELR